MKAFFESITAKKKQTKVNVLKVVVLSILLGLLFYLYLNSVESILAPWVLMIALIVVLLTVWERWARNLAIFAIIVFLFHIYQQISALLFPFMASFIVAILFGPLIDFAERKKIKRTLAVLILFVILIIVIVLVSIFIIPQIIDQGVALAKQFSGLGEVVKTLYEQTTELQVYLEDPRIEPYATPAIEILTERGEELFSGLFGFIVDLLSSAGTLVSGLLNIILIPIVSFYLLRDLPKIKKFVKNLIPPTHTSWVIDLYHDIDKVIGGYIRGQSTVIVMEATFISIALTIIGIENALLLGIFAGLCNIVPYVGYVLAMIPLVIVGLMSPEDPLLKTGLSIAVFVVIQFIDGNIIAPRILGKQVGVHPVLVMIGILAGAKFFGVIGIMLAVPVMGVIRVFGNRLHQQYLDSDLYSKGSSALSTKEADDDQGDDNDAKTSDEVVSAT